MKATMPAVFCLLLAVWLALSFAGSAYPVHEVNIPEKPVDGEPVVSSLATAPGENPPWQVDTGYRTTSQARLSLQSYVTPEDEDVAALSANIESVTQAYEIALRWPFVSDMRLLHEVDKWLTPHEFLADTALYPANPVPGDTVSDCEEQANVLVSMLRALGVPPGEVRVAVGEVVLGSSSGGHAWAELLIDGKWLALDPASGSYWDDAGERLINRRGLPFYFYRDYDYPVSKVWLYYNDIYLCNSASSGYAPYSWLEDEAESSD